jgi:hypothetical protein
MEWKSGKLWLSYSVPSLFTTRSSATMPRSNDHHPKSSRRSTTEPDSTHRGNGAGAGGNGYRLHKEHERR